MIDARIELGDPTTVPEEEDIPGESRPVRAVLALPDERVGVLVGHLPATRRWDAADQDLLELYASEVAVAIRNVELFDQVEQQRQRLVELDAAKDEFLRGISHNLQTPLTSIRAYAEQMGSERPDPRLVDHRRADRPAVPHRPPARRDVAPRVRHAPAGRRRCSRSRPGSAAPGTRSAPWASRSSSTTTPRAGSRSPTRISWTRSCGRCSTTPSRYGGGAPIRARVAPAAGRRRSARGHDRRRRPGRPARGPRPDLRAIRARRGRRQSPRARASGCTSPGRSARRWAATSSSSRRSPEPGAAFTVLLPAEPPATESVKPAGDSPYGAVRRAGAARTNGKVTRKVLCEDLDSDADPSNPTSPAPARRLRAPVRAAPEDPSRAAPKSRGQSLAEFALTVPVRAPDGPVRARLRARLPGLGRAQQRDPRGRQLRGDEPERVERARTSRPCRPSTSAPRRDRGLEHQLHPRRLRSPHRRSPTARASARPSRSTLTCQFQPHHPVHRRDHRQSHPGDGVVRIPGASGTDRGHSGGVRHRRRRPTPTPAPARADGDAPRAPARPDSRRPRRDHGGAHGHARRRRRRPPPRHPGTDLHRDPAS